MTNLSSRTFLVAGGFVAAAFLIGSAQAITESAFRYSTPQTGHMTFQGVVFVPQDSSTANNYSSSLSGGLTTSTGGHFVTPVHLPHGAKITELRAWYKTETCIYLLRSRLVGGQGDIPAAECFNNASGDVVAGRINLAGSPIEVDNARYSYSLRVFVNSSSAFFNGRITYTYTTAGD